MYIICICTAMMYFGMGINLMIIIYIVSLMVIGKAGFKRVQLLNNSNNSSSSRGITIQQPIINVIVTLVMSQNESLKTIPGNGNTCLGSVTTTKGP